MTPGHALTALFFGASFILAGATLSWVVYKHRHAIAATLLNEFPWLDRDG
jgi:hypothetical protein